MRCIRVSDPSTFDETVSKTLQKSPNGVFVHFFGREVPETGESWCPDCVIADPKIRSAVATVPDSILIEVPVDNKLDQESPTQVFRQRADIALTELPTLLRWMKNGARPRLVEDECLDKDDILKFIERTTA